MRTTFHLCAWSLLCVVSSASLKSQISINASGFVSENFNSMGTGTTLPTGFQMSAAGATANWNEAGNVTAATQIASSGSPTTAGRYNWGTIAGTDRAIGFMTDGSYASPNTILAQIHNSTGATITSLTITFQVERYRINSSAFYLQFYSSSTGGAWTSQSAGDISAAVFTPATSSYTFATPQTVYKSVGITGLSIANGADYYFRWVFGSAGTNGQGLGLDNVTINVDTGNPAVTATLSDGVTTAVKQGDPLTYSATINNSGKDATGVQYNATPDANTTLNGAAKSSPLARDDSYATAINTQLSGQNVLTNDFGLPSLSVLSFGPTETPTAANAGNSGFSDNGGIVVLNSNGAFTYDPPSGFVGYDRFAYTAHAGVTPDDVGIVTIAVGSMVSAGTAESFPGVIGNVAVNNAPSLLSNDVGDALKIAAINNNAVSSFPFTTTTTHGNLTVNANGTFVYNPAAGYEGTDNFSYAIDNGFSSAQIVTVNITVTGMIWFIDNTAGSGGDGRLLSPFNSLTNFQTVNDGGSGGLHPSSGDYIFIYSGSGNYTQSVTLLSGQKLIGAGATATLSTITGFTVPSYSAALPATGGTSPVIANSVTNVITLASGTTVRGIATSGGSHSIIGSTVADVKLLENTFNSATAEGVLLTAASGTSAITNNTVASTGIGIKLTTTTASGALNLNFSNNSLTSGSTGANLDGSAGGTFTITGFASNSVSGNTVGSGIVINTAKFDAIAGGAFSMVSGGSTNIGAAGNGVGGSGLSLTSVSGILYFNDLDIYADGGSGLSASGTGVLIADAGTGFGMMVDPDVSIIEATGGPAINISSASLSLPLLSVKSTNSSTTGISLVNTYPTSSNPTLSISSSSGSLTNATGNELNIDGGSGSITIPIPISSSAGNAVAITSHTSGTVNISGSVSASAGGGISLSNNTGSTINFSGQLSISTGANAGFAATGGGTVTVTGSNNTITTSTGTALNIANTTIGSSGVTFKSISANGGSNGIILDNTGLSGGLTVTGDGTNTTVGGNSSGGTIQNMNGADEAVAGNGIYLTNTRNVVLRRMTIAGTNQNHGIRGISVTNFTLEYSTVSGTNGNSAALDEGSVNFDNLWGTTSALTSCIIEGGFEDNLNIVNTSGTLNRLTITGSTFGFNNTANGNNNILIESQNAGTTLNWTLQSSVIKGARADWLNATNNSSSTMDAIIGGVGGGNTFDNLGTNAHPGAVSGGNRLVLGATGPLTFDINANTFKGSKGGALFVRGTGTVGGLTGTVNGYVRNNTIGVQATANSGSSEGSGIAITGDGGSDMNVAITNNSVYQYNNSGIQFTFGDEINDGSVFNITCTGNIVSNPGTLLTNFNGINLNNGTVAATDNFTTCFHMSGNTLTGSGSGLTAPNNQEFRLRQRQATTVRLPGYAGANNDDAAVVTFLASQNTVTTGQGAASNTVPTGGGFVGGAACTQPSN